MRTRQKRLFWSVSGIVVVLGAISSTSAGEEKPTPSQPAAQSTCGVVNVRNFGALGDGSAALATAEFIEQHGRLDDSMNPLVPDVRYRADWDTKDFVGLQCALDHAGKHGKKVYIPAGKYVLSRPLFFKYDGMKVFGDGMHKTLVLQGNKSAGQNWLDELSDTALVKVGVTVYGTADYGTGKRWGKTRHVTIGACEVSHVGFVGRGGSGRWMGQPGNESGNSGILLDGHKDSWATGNFIHHCFFTGFEEAAVEPECQRQLTIADNECRDCGWQFVGTDAANQYVVITRNTIVNPGQQASSMAINFEAHDGLPSVGIVVSENVMTGTNEGFLKLHTGNGSTIEDVLVINNKATCYTKSKGWGHGCIRVYTQGAGDVKRLTIVNNTISTGQGQHGMALCQAGDVVISGNTLDMAGGGYGIWTVKNNHNVAILGNTLKNCTAHAIVIGEGVKSADESPVGVRICHNRVEGSGERLLAIYAADGLEVLGNTLIGKGPKAQYGILSAWSQGLAGSIQIKGNVIRGAVNTGVYLTVAKGGKQASLLVRSNVVEDTQNAFHIVGKFAPVAFEANLPRTK